MLQKWVTIHFRVGCMRLSDKYKYVYTCTLYQLIYTHMFVVVNAIKAGIVKYMYI